VWALLISFLIPYTDNWAHIGGLAGGFGIAYLAGHPNLSHPRHERYWNIAGLGVAGFVVICFVVQFFTTIKYLQS
jgi:hypothetical protein